MRTPRPIRGHTALDIPTDMSTTPGARTSPATTPTPIRPMRTHIPMMRGRRLLGQLGPQSGSRLGRVETVTPVSQDPIPHREFIMHTSTLHRLAALAAGAAPWCLALREHRRRPHRAGHRQRDADHLRYYKGRRATGSIRLAMTPFRRANLPSWTPVSSAGANG